jgi:glycosyltransferase involved in cell wall biosynthesis
MPENIALLTCREFKIPGGAERLEIDIAKALNATIVCLDLDPAFRNIYPLSKEVKFHALKKSLPEEPLKQIFGMHLFRRIHLDFDFYIVIDDMALRFLTNPVPHIYYMHTPRRVFYDMYYPTLTEYSFLKRLLMRPVLIFFRLMDQQFVKKHVKNIACNSHNTRTRIWKFYQREAKVIYPPIHIDQYENKKNENFWLSVTRVDKWKRIELQIETFRRLPEKKLLIAGKIYPSYKKLVSDAPVNVKFLDTVTDLELLKLYSTCNGLITTAIDEDFGITPIESMASGKPVVAVKEGGYQETVVDGITGRLVAPDPDELAEAIIEIDKNPGKFSRSSRERSENFDYKIFKEQLLSYVEFCANED